MTGRPPYASDMNFRPADTDANCSRCDHCESLGRLGGGPGAVCVIHGEPVTGADTCDLFVNSVDALAIQRGWHEAAQP